VGGGWPGVKNQRFNIPKTKNCITEVNIIFKKLTSGGMLIPDSRVRDKLAYNLKPVHFLAFLGRFVGNLRNK
jgi:hypothetical protein